MILEIIIAIGAFVMMHLELIIASFALLISFLSLLVAMRSSERSQKKKQHLQNTLERRQQEQTALEAAHEIVKSRSSQLAFRSEFLSIPRPRSLEESFKMKSSLEATVANWKKIASLFDSDTQRDIGETLKKAMGHPSNGASSGEEFVSAWNVFLDLLSNKITEKLKELALDIKELKRALYLRTGISPWDL